MTTILGVCNGKNAWIIADKQTTFNYGDKTIGLNLNDQKIRKSYKIQGNYLIGFAGAVYTCDFFNENFQPDQKQFDRDNFYLAKRYISCKKDQKEFFSEQEEQEFALSLIVTTNSVIQISDEMSIFKNPFNRADLSFAAIGSGSLLAEYTLIGQIMALNKKTHTDSQIEKMMINCILAASDDVNTSKEYDLLKI